MITYQSLLIGSYGKSATATSASFAVRCCFHSSFNEIGFHQLTVCIALRPESLNAFEALKRSITAKKSAFMILVLLFPFSSDFSLIYMVVFLEHFPYTFTYLAIAAAV